MRGLSTFESRHAFGLVALAGALTLSSGVVVEAPASGGLETATADESYGSHGVAGPATSGSAGVSVRSGGTEADAGRQVVALVTGDRVALTRFPGGRTAVHLLPGSPASGEALHAVSLGGQVYVLPNRRDVSGAASLDASMFNVTRLARLAGEDGRVPVRVTFGPGTRPHEVPGVDVETASVRTTGSGASVVRGSYSYVGPVERPSGSWRGVADVSLPGRDAGDPEPVVDEYELHTLTVNYRDRQGEIPEYVEAFVINVDDGRLFNWLDLSIVDGQAKLSVPDGNYAVLGWFDAYQPVRSSSVAAEQSVEVTADTEVTISASEATARVRGASVPGARLQQNSFYYIRHAETSGGAMFFIGYPPRSGPVYVEPAPPPAVGDLRSGVHSALRIRHDSRPATVVETMDWQLGVPKTLSYSHPRTEFAEVTARYHSDGRAQKELLETSSAAFFPGQFLAISGTWPAKLPLQRHELYLGDPSVSWYHQAYLGFNSWLTTGRRNYRPGWRPRESWLRGPLAPGIGMPVRRPLTGRYCSACRSGDHVRINLAPFTDSTPDHSGYSSSNPWALRKGGRVIGSGSWPLTEVDVPAGRARYSLKLRHAMPDQYALSAQESTIWRFWSKHGRGPLPLLVPRFRLPVDMMNRLPAGRTGFRLAVPRLGDGEVRIVKPTVKVSYNGGQSWKRATVVRRAAGVFRVRVVNPTPSDNPRYGSLRVHAEDRAGNTVTTTVKRAWRVRGGTGSLGDSPGDEPPPSDSPAVDLPRRACDQSAEHTVRCFTVVQASGPAALDVRARPAGYGARALRDAYDLPREGADGQTVAVVVAWDYPTAARDLNVYREQYGLPPCTRVSGCFTKLNQDGEQGSYPQPDQGWALEAALDLQMASAACPRCKLVLVEAKSSQIDSIVKAVDTAAQFADVVSHSYGGNEFTGIERFAKHYDVDGVPMTVAAGNYGYEPAFFPASAPSVISTGGTALRRADNDRGWRETAWQYGSSGCSAYFAKPAWQTDSACHMRTVADMAAVASPDTGVAVYDSTGYHGEKGWFVLGGTSTAAPLIAGMIAAAGDADTFTTADLYANTKNLNDVTVGSNNSSPYVQTCMGSYICTAKPGYDAPTGHGTPNGLDAFTDVTP